MGEKNGGYIVIETLISFTLFTLLIAMILSFVNLTVVQARVHYAMTQTAQTVSTYCYVLEAAGAAEHIQNLQGKAAGVQAEADEFKANLNSFLGEIDKIKQGNVNESTFENTYNAANAGYQQISAWTNDIVDDPKTVIQKLAGAGLQEAEDYLFGRLTQQLMGHYLKNGLRSGDEYLKRAGVVGGLDGLQFYKFTYANMGRSSGDHSVLLTEAGDVTLIVEYDLDYSFGALILPESWKTIHVVQTVKTRAWLGGKGNGYDG